MQTEGAPCPLRPNRGVRTDTRRLRKSRSEGSRSSKLTIVTTLPTWAVWVLSFGSPAITAVIALLGQYFNRRAAGELETRSKREEVLRNLRWAAELAVSDDIGKARLGMQELQALRDSRMLTPSEEGFVDAALRAAIEEPRQAIAQSTGQVEVIATTGPHVSRKAPISSEKQAKQEEAGI